MATLKFINHDVHTQMSTARELIAVARELDQVIGAPGLSQKDSDRLRDARRRLTISIDKLIGNVEQVQRTVIDVVRTSSGL